MLRPSTAAWNITSFLRPKGDCKGLYVTNETADSFEVRELGGGKSNIAFDYRIIARRKGYENVRLADKTKQFDRIVNEPRPVPGQDRRAEAASSHHCGGKVNLESKGNINSTMHYHPATPTSVV